MRRFLTSSTVSIPWSYEGHNHSPEAYFQNDPTLTYEEKQELLKEAEKDSVIFANTVCALAEFISALPENINEICFCFSCPDRLVRDTMVLSMRSLAFLPSNCSRYERKSMFPWLKHSNNTNNLIAESNENEKIETKRILNKKEEENIILKKERNELTLQLLESREELVNLKNKLNTIQNSSTNSSNNDNKRNSLNNSNNNINKKGIIDEPFNGFPPSNTETNSNNNNNTNTTGSNNSTSSSNMSDGKAEAFKQLSSKIIELENKLAVASKREVRERGGYFFLLVLVFLLYISADTVYITTIYSCNPY